MFLFLAVGGPQEGHALHQTTCARASVDSGTCMNKIAWVILWWYLRVYSCLHSVSIFCISRELREYVLVPLSANHGVFAQLHEPLPFCDRVEGSEVIYRFCCAWHQVLQNLLEVFRGFLVDVAACPGFQPY